MTILHDKALSELKTRLAKLPKADRGISWQLYNWQHTEELTVYGSTANCLKWILDNTEEIIAALHAPIEAGCGGDGWNRDMDAAPKDKSPVIIAVLHKDNDAYIIGEAYFDPEHYGDGDWWWAGNSYGDYHGGPISEINYHGPSAWRPLPSPPSPSNEGEKP